MMSRTNPGPERLAVYTGTRNVYSDMITACKSLLFHDGADRVVLMTEDDAFSEPLPDMVQTMNVSNQQYFDRSGPNYNRKWTYMTLMKVAAPLMFPESRVLTLDIDTIVDDSLDALWALPREAVYMAREIGRPGEYYNAGVMLMDPELFLPDAKRIIDAINTRDYTFCEQDAVNEIMRGRIKPLPPEYNASNWTVRPSVPPVITHYAAVPHWQDRPLWKKYEQMGWDEVLLERESRNHDT